MLTHARPTTGRAVGTATLALTILALAVTAAAQSGRGEDTADVRRLVKGLDLQAGMTVAEIGAGKGALSIALAREVGASGRLFTSELGADRVGTLRKAIESAHADNVTIIDGAAADTQLPAACCDAIFMRDVYHHFADPEAMNESLKRSLKPCGRLAILDFAPGGNESPTPAGRAGGNGTHGITMRTLKGELSRAGFVILSDDPAAGQNFLVIAQRPAGEGQIPGSCPQPTRTP